MQTVHHVLYGTGYAVDAPALPVPVAGPCLPHRLRETSYPGIQTGLGKLFVTGLRFAGAPAASSSDPLHEVRLGHVVRLPPESPARSRPRRGRSTLAPGRRPPHQGTLRILRGGDQARDGRRLGPRARSWWAATSSASESRGAWAAGRAGMRHRRRALDRAVLALRDPRRARWGPSPRTRRSPRR